MQITTAAAIAGLHTRYDVATKCKIVSFIMSSSYPTKAALNLRIEGLAVQFGVNPVSIKVWCAKYATTYMQGMALPAGVMSFVATPILNAEINVVSQKLATIRSNLLVVQRQYHPGSTNKSTEILGKLIK
jgi:hypothetical protein